ncbi:MAG: alpha-amylase [Clostridiales bacterium]|nr:alpha-amylase [Clostridiales bacterium]
MKIKKVLSALMAAVVTCSFGLCSVACGGDESNPAAPKNTDPYDIPQDYCRTYYEVFVRSFADGNNDGIGDLKGLIKNLDYLNDGDDSTTDDLGINGIWLMPINQSPSYHKYDVTDYYDIDDEYGTLEDFDELVKECNKRGIWIQMDLVLNHTSSQHPWFKQARNDARAGKVAGDGIEEGTSKYMAYYNFYKWDEGPRIDKARYEKRGEGFEYLCNFDSAMPDLNLQHPDVRAEITKIVDFWLERGVKSFRLDAVPWANAYDSIYNEENGEFWTWFNDYCHSKGAEVAAAQGWANDAIAKYCYNVGEVWADNDTVQAFFGTGMSNFNYAVAANPDIGYAQVINGFGSAASFVEKLVNIQAGVLGRDPDALLSNFLSNHDNDRSSCFFGLDKSLIKKAAGLYLLSPGNPYIYYGEEIGANGFSESSQNNDPNKRLPFNWGDGRSKIQDPPGANFSGKQRLGSWKSQNTDPNSILTYYRNAIKLRNRFPEIGRGLMKAYRLDASGKIVEASAAGAINSLNTYVAVYTLTWKDRTVLIAHNIGEEDAVLDISNFAGYSLQGMLKADGGNVKLDDNKLTMSPSTVAVLKAV